VSTSGIDRALAGASPVRRWAPVLGGLVAAMCLLWRPGVPDFAAQTAWAGFVRHAGLVPVFANWYGGVALGSYSLIVPPLMSVFGVAAVGAVAGLSSILIAAALLRQTRHPLLALLVFAVAVTANLVCGRVTFATGVALAAGALLCVTRRRTSAALFLGVAACLASPVAAVVLLVPLAALACCDPDRRTPSTATMGGVALTLVGLAWAFPLAGYEPFNRDVFLLALGIALAALALSASRPMRIATVLGVTAIVAAYLVHTPLGGDIARLPVLLMPAAVIAQARVPRRLTVLLAAAACVYPIAQAANDLTAAHDVSTRPAFTTGLQARLAGEPIARTHRIEVVDAGTHWGAVRLSNAGFAVARGWLTQADQVDNPLFYGRAPLTAGSYRAFLDRTASAYVAVEHAAPLDSGAQAEAALIAGRLPYLTDVWSDRYWTLYRVSRPRPLATGVATVVRTTDTGVVLDAARPGAAHVDLNWSRYLTVDGGEITRDGTTITVALTTPGIHVIRGAWPWNVDHDTGTSPPR
jgi:hypothetical protein